ncbi:hypothetical protein ACLB1M_20325 [Escherichia coli]
MRLKISTALRNSNTLTLARNPAEKALPGFKKVKPQVYASCSR